MRCSALRVWRTAAVALVVFLTAPIARATVVLPLDLASIAGRSHQIVRGTVVSLASRWNEDSTLIVTDVVIEVRETFKGVPRKSVTLEVVGGRVGDLVLDVVDSPDFATGEEVVVFAADAADGKLRLPGLGQDKYRVERDQDGRRWVSNRRYPLGLLVPDLSRALDAGGRLPYEAFVHRLRGAVAGGGR